LTPPRQPTVGIDGNLQIIHLPSPEISVGGNSSPEDPLQQFTWFTAEIYRRTWASRFLTAPA
jgi:hypothetical protein